MTEVQGRWTAAIRRATAVTMFESTRLRHSERGFGWPRRAGPAAGLVFVVASLSACASMRHSDLFNPTIEVEVEHPPGVGFVLNEVVFAEADEQSFLDALLSGSSTDRCRAEWVQALTQMLIEGGIRVARDDENADAMIAVEVTRCDTEQARAETSREVVETIGDNARRRIVPEYHARTQVSFRSTVEVTDLSTGLVAVSRTFSYEPERTYSSEEGYPDFPSSADVVRQAYGNAIDAVMPMFFHWLEVRELVFFDDERCGLNLAYQAFEGGDHERALEISIANAESCQPDPAAEIGEMDVAAAHYNVGLLYRIAGDFGSAMESFEQAQAADPNNGVIRDAIEEALSAEATAAALGQAGQEEVDRTIRNDDIVSMYRDGIADEVILEVIRTSEVDFDVSGGTLAELSREGLSPAVIAAMVAAAGRSDPEAGTFHWARNEA